MDPRGNVSLAHANLRSLDFLELGPLQVIFHLGDAATNFLILLHLVLKTESLQIFVHPHMIQDDSLVVQHWQR